MPRARPEFQVLLPQARNKIPQMYQLRHNCLPNSENKEFVLVNIRFILRVIASAGLVLASGLTQAAERRAVTHEDLWLLPRVGAPAVSPDGKLAVFSVVEPAYNADQQASDLWMVATDGKSEPRRLTQTRAPEAGMNWSPDSKRVAFSAKREGDEANQIYVLDIVAG